MKMRKFNWDDIPLDILKLYESAPKEAFPYSAPSKSDRVRYEKYFMGNAEPLPIRPCKRGLDVIVGLIFLIASLPILCLLFIAYLIEGFFIPSSRGPLLYFYHAVSQGKKIKKWKIRQVKWPSSQADLRRSNDWIAFSSEWDKSQFTYVGRLVKMFYLDELPQFWSIVRGDISLVGPRPLCTVHFLMDVDNGNICRKMLPGGLLGLGHLNKGTTEMGQSSYEYEYLKRYIEDSCFSLILLDLKILYKGFVLVAKGGGH
jgi:lipopolysaccharide/colanic/teichoic acid biosynthesis glycosyltransferase